MTPPYLTRPALRSAAALLTTTAALALGAAAATANSGGGGLGAAPTTPSAPATPRTPATPTTPTSPATPTAPSGPVPRGELVIHGGGNGHGIGMSQYGAQGYALHGASDRAILAHYYQGTTLGHTDPARVVRVLLADGSASFTGASAAGPARLSPARTYVVTATGIGDGVQIDAGGRTVATVSGTLSVTGPGPLRTAGGSYRGALQFSADTTGGVRTVDAVGLDDYVRGVVAAEMPSSWDPAALEAQAIAARTYAITTSVDGTGYDLFDDTRSQVYGGVGAETAPTDAAVAATAGQVVTDGGRPAVTYFFSSSGGHTESIQNVWPGSAPEPWLTGVTDPYDGAAQDPYHSWTVTMTTAAATAKLGSLVRGTLRQIVVTRHGVSPRIVAAQVVGSRGTTTVTGGQLEQAFGLLSTDARFSVG
jgi:stage II sporulation protein D